MTTASSVSSEPMNDALLEPFGFLIRPEVLQFVEFKGLIHLRQLGKAFRDIIDKSPEEVGYWKTVSNAFLFYAGIYSHVTGPKIQRMDYKKYFFDHLWNSRNKWTTDGSDLNDNQSYRIKVASRFRPGVMKSDKVCLPLHQFLKVKRHQKALRMKMDSESEKNAAMKSNGEDLFVGEKDPEEFLDPFLGNLMKDPVLLKPSQRIVDRSVAVQCILRGGKDPFNSERLTMQMLIAQPELAERIQQFRVKKQQWDVSLELQELKPLVDETAVNAELLEALMEVEQLNVALRKAELDAIRSNQHAATAAAGNENNIDADAAALALGLDDDPAAVADPAAPAAEEENLATAAAAAAAGLVNPFALGNNNQASQSMLPAAAGSKKAEIAGIVDVNEQTATVSMHVPGSGVRPFQFSNVHKGDATQQQVYDKSAQDAIATVLNGFNACIMCYGQTGAGKTYTFFGPDGTLEKQQQQPHRSSSKQQQQQDQDLHGIVVRSCEELLRAKECLALNGITVSYTAQFVEIYEEQVTDLLTGRTVTIRRDNGHINGATEAPMNSMEEVLETLRSGQARKQFAATAMNERSSRSHTALVIHVLQKLHPERMAGFAKSNGPAALCEALRQSTSTGTGATAGEGEGVVGGSGDKLIKSQLHLVDLAGSERVKKSKAEGTRLREAVGINSSLLVLGKVISALVKGNSHVPYFESELTKMLKAAFGGNSKTTVVVNCRSDGEHGDETLQSMRFGERCGMISNSLRQAAASFDTALAAVDEALQGVQAQLASLERRQKQHLPSYKALLLSYQTLNRKRTDLLAMNHAANNAKNDAAAAAVSSNTTAATAVDGKPSTVNALVDTTVDEETELRTNAQLPVLE
mmetsp:Transcript_25467/g.42490  ORF Transcript_25467/g.42490 Transcript_25467/m.42490 type:complete len:864 (+) Transcript_25467:35-2626(+)